MSCSAGPKIITGGLVFNLDPSNSKSYPAINDPYRNDVSLLLDFDGANGSTTFVDKSLNNLTVTANGNAQISTTQSKFGGSAGYFDGNDWITLPTSTALSLGTGQFTIEFWIRLDSIPSSGSRVILYTGDSSGSIIIRLEPSTGYIFCERNFTDTNQAKTNVGLSANTWQHIAITRDSSNIMRIFIDGVQRGSGTITSDYNSSGGAIMASTTGTQGLAGYIDDLRITKGFARYTSSFTPPDRLTTLPARAYDLRNDATATLTSGPVFSNVQNGVISFDGTDDYATFSTNNNYALGSGDFTVEFLVNLNSSHQFSLIDFRINETNPNGNAFVIGTNASNQWVVYKGANQITGATSVARTWNHIVVTRVGTSIRLYIDGVQSGSTWTSSDNFTDNALLIGTDYPKNARFFNGKFSYLRIYKGKGFSSNDVALNYAAVRQKFTEIPRTFSGLAVWFDGADLSTLRQNSNATTAATLNSDPVGYWADKSGNGRNATQATAGNRAALSNGARSLDPAINFAANNWLDLASYTASFGTGSFTIEGWIKPAGYSGTSILLTTGMSGMFVCFTPAGLLNFGKYGVGTTIASTSAISTTSWTKFAITRSGTSLKLFLNDVLNASATDSLSYTGGSAMRIGFDAYSPTGNTKYNGLLQNLLIYEGFSKYN